MILNALSSSVPPLDEEEIGLLKAHFMGPPYPAGGLARVRLLLAPPPPPLTSHQPYIGPGQNYMAREEGKQDKPTSSATSNKPSKDSMVLTKFPHDSTKCQVDKPS